MLIVETFPTGDFMANCTVLGDGVTKDAVVVDPGGSEEEISEIIGQHDYTVRAILLTHGHIDHVMAVRAVKEAHGGEICIHPADRFLYEGLRMQAMMFGLPAGSTPPVERELADGDELVFGAIKAKVVHTPGHTPGSVCFEIVDEDRSLLLSGDTLFYRGIGRTDLPGGDTRAIERSLRMLYQRYPSIEVVPGHGPNTTTKDEARLNPFVRAR